MSGDLDIGSEIRLRIDQTLTQDATGTMVSLELDGHGLDRARTEVVVQYVDHNLLQTDSKNETNQRGPRTLEIISPAGFEQLFVELSALLETSPTDAEATLALGARYGIESDPEATARVIAEHGLIERSA